MLVWVDMDRRRDVGTTSATLHTTINPGGVKTSTTSNTEPGACGRRLHQGAGPRRLDNSGAPGRSKLPVFRPVPVTTFASSRKIRRPLPARKALLLDEGEVPGSEARRNRPVGSDRVGTRRRPRARSLPLLHSGPRGSWLRKVLPDASLTSVVLS